MGVRAPRDFPVVAAGPDREQETERNVGIARRHGIEAASEVDGRLPRNRRAANGKRDTWQPGPRRTEDVGVQLDLDQPSAGGVSKLMEGELEGPFLALVESCGRENEGPQIQRVREPFGRRVPCTGDVLYL